MSSGKDKAELFALLFRRVGDSLLATPALRAIKKKFPEQRLNVIIEPQVRRIFELNPVINEILVTEKSPSPFQLAGQLKRGGRPALTLDFLSDPRTALACLLAGAHTRVGFKTSLRSLVYTHRVPLQDEKRPVYSALHKLGLAFAAGAADESLETDFFLKDSDAEFANAWKQRTHIHEATRIIAVFPFSRRDYKRWPPDRYISLCKKLQAVPDFFPVVISGPGEADYCSMIAAAASLDERHSIIFDDLGKMAAFLRLSSLYIGNDGGPKHLAVAVGTPTITIFLNDPPEYWTPPGSLLHTAISTDSALGISVEAVLNEIHRMIERCG